MEISVKISQRDSPKFNKRSTWMLIWPHQLHELHTMVHFFKQRFTRNLLDKNKDQYENMYNLVICTSPKKQVNVLLSQIILCIYPNASTVNICLYLQVIYGNKFKTMANAIQLSLMSLHNDSVMTVKDPLWL